MSSLLVMACECEASSYHIDEIVEFLIVALPNSTYAQQELSCLGSVKISPTSLGWPQSLQSRSGSCQVAFQLRQRCELALAKGA